MQLQEAKASWTSVCNERCTIFACVSRGVSFVSMCSRWGVGDRGASVRVGNLVPLQKCGYLEDRRPSGDLDPYVVTRMLVETTLLLQ
jgi:glutamine synthetase